MKSCQYIVDKDISVTLEQDRMKGITDYKDSLPPITSIKSGGDVGANADTDTNTNTDENADVNVGVKTDANTKAEANINADEKVNTGVKIWCSCRYWNHNDRDGTCEPVESQDRKYIQ